MNKKFLSAILFGALMVTSTGTFVSCKDYDDDIKDLQTQINSNKDAIAALQQLVGEGNWVTGITAIENGFTVTMSNGQTTTVTGIKGEDGKDGVEWTIGDDGYWYKDGEKTEHQAVAKDGEDGKNGATAPSPYINADGMWVVYEWDSTTEEFVAKTTEISAQGTSAYVVKKDGVYVLHIADETGAFQDVTLPATSDSFVVSAPGSAVDVTFEQANWTPVTSSNDKKLLAKLTEVFPEIADYKKGDLLKQGGNLPVLVTPANVELTDKFSFSLQSIKGEFSEATLSNPVKGMPANSEVDKWGVVTTRSASSESCFWTLNVEPALNKKGDKYVAITEPHSLVIENEKGTVVKTAFAYRLTVTNNSDVTITPQLTSVENADAIDVFAKDENNQAIFNVEHGLNDYFILEATEPLEIEKYQITIDGSNLVIGNMPADQTSITVNLKLTQLGLNGSVAEATTTLTIGQEIAASGSLADKTVTLSSDDNYLQKVRWNIEDLGFTSVQLDQFLSATKTMKLTYVDEDGETKTQTTYPIDAYDKDGNVTSDYKEAVTFGFTLDSRNYVPRDYEIRLEAKSSNDSVVYAAEATLTVNNPTSSAIKLAEALVLDDVLQITGTPASGYITYTMADGFVIKTDASGTPVATNLVFTDLSATDEDPSWISSDNATLSIVDYNYDNAKEQKLYKTRHFKVEYILFGNADNKEEMEFDAVVLSEIYNADATAAIKLKDMSAIFTSDNKKNFISIASNVTSATYAAGSNRGKTYNLFPGVKTTTAGASAAVYDYSKPLNATGSVASTTDLVVSGKNYVEAPKNTDMIVMGFTEAELQDATSANPSKIYYIAASNWDKIWTVAKNYYNADGTTIKVDGKDKEVQAAHKAAVAIFNEYKSKIDFYVTTKAVDGEETTVLDTDKKQAANIESVTVEFVDKETAAKYATIETQKVDGTVYDYKITAKSELDEDIPSGKVTLAVKMTVLDAWGMKMVRNFNVTLSTN